MVQRTRAGSGVPNVGAPDCIDMELANEPMITGAPGLTIWVKAMPQRASPLPIAVPASSKFLIAFLCIGIIAFGIFPQPLLAMLQ